ncbi:MAG: hypothetical protein S4CHLAM102_02250 [Chlamydiia bacterium]|nr:hypothetical protein [Chlamydiia bacterium]
MRKQICALFLLVQASLFSFTLKEQLEKAPVGDYIVTQINKTYSVIAIHSIEAGRVIFEEIDIPQANLKQVKSDWKKWVEVGAPGHSNWMMYEVDLNQGSINECYSFTRMCWVKWNEIDSFLINLLPLALQKVPPSQQKKIGPAPIDPSFDNRRVWKPKLTLEGKKQPKVNFDVYRVEWPSDETLLSNKQIDLYFTDESAPFALPYWVQIGDGSGATFVVQGVEIGHDLSSPQTQMPKRIPEFVGSIHLGESVISTQISTPHYFKRFHLHLIDLDRTQDLPISIPFEMKTKEQGRDLHELNISLDAIRDKLIEGHHYSFIMSVDDAPYFSFESYDQFLWKTDKTS